MTEHLDENGLARRWHMSARTLQQWRWQGKGPRFLKLGNRVVYPLDEVEAHEAANLHANTTGPIADVSPRRGDDVDRSGGH